MPRKLRKKEAPVEVVVSGTLAWLALGIGMGWVWFSSPGLQSVIQQGALGWLAFGAILAWRWRAVLADVAATQSAFESRAQLAALSPEQFERWCAARLEALGFAVDHVGGQADHGVDLVAKKDGATTVVQCKRYTGSRTVGEPQVRDLFGAMHDFGATRAMVITAGRFTDEARSWSSGKPIDLWDVDRLAQLGAPPPATTAASPVVSTPPCDRCGSEMSLRRNRATGDAFYGCSTYPRCRFTRQLTSARA